MQEQKIPTLMLRRKTEAWANPFVVVFNPYFEGGENPISKVSFGENEDTETQYIHVYHSEEKCKDLIVANASENDIASGNGVLQKGLISVTRWTDGESHPDFLFVSGIYKFENEGWEIIASKEAATVSIEKVEQGFVIQSDQPILIRIPVSEGFHPTKMDIMEEDRVIQQKDGMISRLNPDQVEFRLAKPCVKAVIYLNH
jgi:hypothetical protein